MQKVESDACQEMLRQPSGWQPTVGLSGGAHAMKELTKAAYKASMVSTPQLNQSVFITNMVVTARCATVCSGRMLAHSAHYTIPIVFQNILC